MVIVGGVNDAYITKFNNSPFAQTIALDPTIINTRLRRVFVNQLTDGTQTAIAELAGITISNIGRTELTLVGAVSVDDVAYYGGQTVSITYKDNEGVTHTAGMTIDGAATDTEVAFTNSGDNSNGDNEDGKGAVTDFYQLLTMTTSKITDAGETIGLGSTGALTMGVIQAAATAAVAADIGGVGEVWVRGIDDSASMQSKANVLEYFTPWGELKIATASTVANATTEVRFVGADGSTFVGDFYRVSTFSTETVPAGGKYMFITDDACGNVDGSGGDIYGVIEEGILQSIHSNLYAGKYRRTFICSYHIDMPEAGANAAVVQIHCTPLDAAQPIIIQHNATGHMDGCLFIEVEPDTEITWTIADAANAATADISLVMIYGIAKEYYDDNANGQPGILRDSL